MKKLLSLFLALALVFSTAVMPVLAEEDSATEATPTPEYYLKGIYNGATVVLSQEPTKTVTLVDAANANEISDDATNVSKVVFTFNGASTEVTGTTFSYTMEFSATGSQTLKYDVYKTGNETETPDESDTITFNVVKGTKNAASFSEDFEGTFADEAALAKAFVGNNGKNYSASDIPLTTAEHKGSKALLIDSNHSSAVLQFRGAPSETGHKVHYYEFDFTAGYSYAHHFYVRGEGYSSGTNQVALFNTQYKPGGSWFFGIGKLYKVAIVLDYNETPIATIYINGKEFKRVPLDTAVAGSKDPVLALNVHASGNPIYIDNFKYSVYDKIVEDVTPTYFVKGIYDGAVVVAQEEESRQITVVDSANNGTTLNLATNVSKVEFYKDDALVATDDVVPFTYDLKFDSYGAHKFQAKIYDVHGNVYDDFVSNYKVAYGVKNQTSTEIDYEELTITNENGETVDNKPALIASTIESYDSTYTAVTVENYKNSNMLKIAPTSSANNSKTVIFKGVTEATGHKVYYYEFDMSTYRSYKSQVLVNGVEAFHTQSFMYGSENSDRVFNTSTATNYRTRNVRIVLDYNATPTAIVLLDGAEYNRIPMTDVNGETVPVLAFSVHKFSDPIYIDNFKFAAYDKYENFGLNEYQDEIIFDEESHAIRGTICKFVISASNSTNAPVTVRNFFVSYDGDGRLITVYPKGHGQWRDSTDENLTYTFQPDVYNQEVVLRCGVGDSNARSAKVFTYVVDAEGKIDFAPIADFD